MYVEVAPNQLVRADTITAIGINPQTVDADGNEQEPTYILGVVWTAPEGLVPVINQRFDTEGLAVAAMNELVGRIDAAFAG